MINSTSKKTIPFTLALIIFLLWITPGLVDRDLWKADEPYSFGLVNHIVKTGDWIVPTLTGQPFLEKPPLFYITAAGFARTFSPWMKLHDAARLATALYMFLTVLFIGLTARELFDKSSFGIAMIMLIGTTGLQETGHKLITDTAMIAGIALGLYGLAMSRRRAVLGGILLGTGAGIGFMSKGLLAPGMLGIIALALPILFAAWRSKIYMQTLAVALAAVLPWFLFWPIALYLRSPELFREWFWIQNIGRFTSTALIGQRNSHFYYLTQLPYFALPGLPCALWAVWRNRRSLRDNAGVQLALLAFLVMLAVLSLSSSIRDLYALPMLLPLTLLASAGVDSVPARAQKSVQWFCIGLFGLAACALWIGWITILSGYPPAFARLLYRPQPDYVPAFHGFLFAIACLYTILWVFFVVRSSQFKLGYLINWTVGIVLTWGLLMTLWLPWFESGSSYRSLFASLREKIPAECTSVRAWGVGESERALLEYYTGLLPRTSDQIVAPGCNLVLVQSGSTRMEPSLGPGWQVIWEQSRPTKPEKRPKEIFTLLQRVEGKKIQRPYPSVD
jgi:4-amino-4-deoxy-L-arabinose transferase-like glycosyltransferase